MSRLLIYAFITFAIFSVQSFLRNVYSEEKANINYVEGIQYKTKLANGIDSLQLKAISLEAEVELVWYLDADSKECSYSVYRGDEKGENLTQIAKSVKSKNYVDFSPQKGTLNSYAVYAFDSLGCKVAESQIVYAKIKAVKGASFIDLILPMPVNKKLRSDLWGTNAVLPRDERNGIEHPDWSYWGGNPTKGKDGKYHMLVARWPETAPKGHLSWTKSEVVHAVSAKPTGPYMAESKTAYSWKNGWGHNPDIVKLNDGSYMLHLWMGHLFTGDSLSGPWNYQGRIEVVDDTSIVSKNKGKGQFIRNLSGLQRKDGSLLFMSKYGRMMMSQDGFMGPYKVISQGINDNLTIPEKYRNVEYEDPTMWKDEVQYHMLINGFLERRAIYLRSPDGVNWKFAPGLAYNPDITRYEDGTKTSWYKLERPHVLQDKYGRATHLSLAVIDVPKREDRSGDKHSSKNIIVPLVVHKRIKMLNKEPIDANSKRIKIMVISEPGFDAQTDIDLSTLRYGAPEKVNFGEGCKLIKERNKGSNLIIEFDGVGNGISQNNFIGKLIGKTNNGELIVAFSKLKAQ